ncbi:RodZ domain-containing protein [Virgibacillus sp. YIM 98842]|uniref:helix-turn-helix domain-containing protein n=1 Tax=Virgibacillus sp. YIM 98842 TaxID=2663533 RepID=UPI0013D9A7B5|nr:RodZ domain-containing protein [Virgibacillus sp. YIM 98842]
MEIGARLKEAREEKNISLDSLQETTKIQKRYLVAIEEGNLQVLPGKFYARAFIKEYANAVGLDPNELLEEYKEEVPKTEDETEVQYSRMQRTRKDSSSEKNNAIFSLLPTIIVILLVIGIFFAAWYFIQLAVSNGDTDSPEEQNDNEEIIINNPEENTDGDAGTGEEETEDTNEEANEEPEEEESEAELSIVEEETSGTNSTFDLNDAGDEVTLTLESSGNTWLEIENEAGESLFSGMFSEDQSPVELDVSDEESVYFNIGNAADLMIIFNDTELEYPIDPNENVVQRIWVNINN